MKKLVLVVVWILLIAVFVVLNYLIWDRENRERDIKSLENLNASNNSSITALGREINNLETQKKRMEAEISYLEKTMADLEDANSKIAKENQKYLETIKHKNEIIYKLIQQSGTKDIEEVISKWVENINSGKYREAYELIRLDSSKNQTLMSLEEFENNYKSCIKSIRIESINLLIENVPEEKKGDIARGDIIFRVLFNVEKLEGIDMSFTQFMEGKNERYVTIDYAKDIEQWVISGISTYY